jgi:uncharacterized membrane protein YphA (DoxX/SURF4 family)
MSNTNSIAALFVRVALGTAFLSAVASRFSIWPKTMGGGSWHGFMEYVAELNPWAPESLIPFLGGAATIAELTFGILLILGFKQRLIGIFAGILLMIFALSMTIGTGVKSPFDYSVYTAAAASFLYAVSWPSLWSFDSLFARQFSSAEIGKNLIVE